MSNYLEASTGLRTRDPEFGEHPTREGERQPDDVGVVAPDPLHESRGPPLYGVASSLAHSLPKADVGFDLRSVEPSHAHARHRVAHGELVASRDGDPGMDLVRASLQQVDESADVFAIPGLSEDAFAHGKVGQVDDRIGGEHDDLRGSRNGEGFASCIGQNGLRGAFESNLGEAALAGLEVVAGGVEQVYPAG